MSAAVAVLLTLVPAYLLGALPWGLWVGLARGIDVRRHGSGNLGATNVYRLLGPAYGWLVLVLDAGKGALAALWGQLGPGAASFPGGADWAALAAVLVAIVGHVLTVFAGFRGGRGVAVTIGGFLALAPPAMGLGLLAFVIAYAASRRVSVGSLALAIVFPIGVLLTESGPERNRLFGLALAASAVVVIRHLPNIRRLLRGEEPPFSLRGKAPDAPGTP